MDVVLLGIIAGFIFGGFRTGFLKRLFGILFAVVSLLLTAYLRIPVGAIASNLFPDVPTAYVDLITSIILFPAALGVLHVVSRSAIERIHVQGVTKEIDAVLGAVLGGVEAILILSALVVFVDAYLGAGSTQVAGIPAGPIKEIVRAFNSSETVHLLRQTTVPFVVTILGPFLPKDLSTAVPTTSARVPRAPAASRSRSRSQLATRLAQISGLARLPFDRARSRPANRGADDGRGAAQPATRDACRAARRPRA